MAESFWKQSNYWWVSIVLLLLSGAGWAIKTYIVKSDEPAILIVKVEPPPGKVTLYVDGKEVAQTSEYGFYRIDGIAPGDHEIQWKVEGYMSKVANIEIQGGKQNKINLPKLEPANAGENVDAPVRENDIVPITEIHKWFAGTRYDGVVDMSEKYGFIWQCSGGTCTLEGPYGSGLNMVVCQELSRMVGGLDYYYNDAGMAWTTTENANLLAQCNTH